jgi:hypothetical protein
MLCVIMLVILMKKMIMTMSRSYSELSKLYTFEERFEYLKLDGEVGRSTFGFDRYLNQKFYASYAWKQARREVILRDNGCDLGIYGYEIYGGLLIHHMNPMVIEDILHGEEWILSTEYLITTTQMTHNAIHYGDEKLLPKIVTERSPNDTKLW